MIPYWECNIKQRNSLIILIAVVHVRVHEANIRDGEKFVNVVFKYLSIGELIASALTT